MATVATGIPGGIWTVDRSESIPFKDPDGIGMPITGNVVWAATTPARWAAIPAAAIKTLIPLDSALFTRLRTSAGVLWAESTFLVYLTSKLSKTSKALDTTSKSESEPIKIATDMLVL